MGQSNQSENQTPSRPDPSQFTRAEMIGICFGAILVIPASWLVIYVLVGIGFAAAAAGPGAADGLASLAVLALFVVGGVIAYAIWIGKAVVRTWKHPPKA